jgi:dihydrofolate reductase
MRKLMLKMSVSIDGFVGGPNGETDWLLNTLDEGVVAWIEDTLWQAGVHIMGSRTFMDMVAYWPTSAEPYAAPMNEIPKVVFSKKGIQESWNSSTTTQALKDAVRLNREKGVKETEVTKYMSTWTDAEIASGDIVDEINRLKQQDGKPILAHGGASFVRSLVQHNLIDEYRLVIHPVALGAGLPLFSTLENPLRLRLINSVKFDCGTVANTYLPF